MPRTDEHAVYAPVGPVIHGYDEDEEPFEYHDMVVVGSEELSPWELNVFGSMEVQMSIWNRVTLGI